MIFTCRSVDIERRNDLLVMWKRPDHPHHVLVTRADTIKSNIWVYWGQKGMAVK